MSPDARSAHNRIAGIDGLRAIAVVLVLVYHLLPGALPGGNVGVDAFFVISGFLITTLLVAELRRTGRIALRRFWYRRLRRIVPALLVAMVTTVSIAGLLGAMSCWACAARCSALRPWSTTGWKSLPDRPISTRLSRCC